MKLLALTALKDVKTENEKIELLNQMDFRNVEIANILNKDPHNVDVVVSQLRKKKSTVNKPEPVKPNDPSPQPVK